MGGPPGWYPDPAAPTVERWWDGTNWTAHTRQAPTGAYPAAPMAPSTVVAPAPSVRNGRSRAVVLGAVAVAVVAAVVAGVLVFGGDDKGDAPPTAGPTGATPTAPTTSATSDAPVDEEEDEKPTRVDDQLNGITLPVIKGWEKPEFSSDPAPTITTVGTYQCPGAATKKCRRGTVSSHPVGGSSTATPEAVAKEDIVLAVKETFQEDILDTFPYGTMVSHKVVAARPAVVAGRTGYLVRWQVITDKGPGGYVQSLAFPSPTGSESPVVVRFLFDAGPDGPALTVMDEITRGIRPIGSDTNGGVGTSITPGTPGTPGT
ncbi:DUF2510 domain-containing protein [Streptomyces sp. NPDC050848]|uniref:DUF2510 domain-containing protein n=1 Tax=Streptomyces sp. NPDC050848 TaxID=3155791 RepID=UPI0033CCADAF